MSRAVRQPMGPTTVPILTLPGDAAALAAVATPVDLLAVTHPQATGEPAARFAEWCARLRLAHRERRGYGVAACQIGWSAAVVLVDPLLNGGVIALNPTITGASGFHAGHDEGCFSAPHRVTPVERPRWVDVTYWTLDGAGEPHHVRASGLASRVWQHECDHLRGWMFGAPVASTVAVGAHTEQP